MIDGVICLDIFFKIILLLLKFIIVYIVLIVFMGFWMDFIFVKVILGDVMSKYIVVIGFFLML